MKEQDIQELLKPRIKCIAPYPGSQFLVGDIFTFTKTFDFEPVDGENEVWYDEKTGVFMSTLTKYPHLFKPLAWYEERDQSQMPEYVKWVEFSPINYDRRLPNGGRIEKAKTIIRGKAIYFEVQSVNNAISAEYFLPATLEEYNQYQQKLENKK